MGKGLGRPRTRGKAQLPPEIIERLESRLATLAGVLCARVDQLCASLQGKGEPSHVTQLASELDRITRWMEKLRKLISDAKPPEVDSGFESLIGLEETLSGLMMQEGPEESRPDGPGPRERVDETGARATSDEAGARTP